MTLTNADAGAFIGLTVGLCALARAMVIALRRQKVDEELCRQRFADQPDTLKYALAQQAQGPGCVLGCGLWIVIGLGVLGHTIGGWVR